MKRELTAASQVFAQLSDSESLQHDLKTVMGMLQDNDALIKNKLVTVEADLKQLHDSTVKALNEGIDHQLWQHAQEAISDVARRLQQVETGGEAQRAVTKPSPRVTSMLLTWKLPLYVVNLPCLASAM